MKYPSIDYALSLPLFSEKAKFDLELPKKLMATLGNPQDKCKVIHVAGTNGKGSTCALIAAMLYAEGFKVAQFLSPHLTSINERCTINGKPVSLESFDKALEKVRTLSSENNLEPSFFVFTFAATVLCAVEEQVDYLVLEVGLGGRLDATNTVKKPLATVITGVALDHTQILGETEYQIAKEKAGILKEGVPAFIGEVGEEARKGIAEVAERVGVEEVYYRDNVGAGFHPRPHTCCESIDFSKLALLGEHQRKNAELAVEVCQYLGLSDQSINRGLEIVRFPGRLEFFSASRAGTEPRPYSETVNSEGTSMGGVISPADAEFHDTQPTDCRGRIEPPADAEFHDTQPTDCRGRIEPPADAEFHDTQPTDCRGGALSPPARAAEAKKQIYPCDILLDIAHNVQGIETLVAYLETISNNYKKITFLISILDRKDIEGMLNILTAATFKKDFVFSESTHKSSTPAESLAAKVSGSKFVHGAETAFKQVMCDAEEGELVVVSGSLFFVSEVRKVICGEGFRTLQ